MEVDPGDTGAFAGEELEVEHVQTLVEVLYEDTDTLQGVVVRRAARQLDSLPAALFNLPNLTELIATDSRMKQLPELGDLPRIESISLSSNHLPEREHRRLRARYPNAGIQV